MNKFLLHLLLLFHCFLTSAQDSSLIRLSGMAEIYYGYDFGNPPDHDRPEFVRSHHRHNEFNINLAFLKAELRRETERASFGLMTGTAPAQIRANEPLALSLIYEANAGIRISKNYTWWVDVGILPSHIGFEPLNSGECWTLTRSILADNSPYFVAGLRNSWQSRDQRWYYAGLVMNGWERITRNFLNQSPALGAQVTFRKDSNHTFNWSAFGGNSLPPRQALWRYYNSFYWRMEDWNRLGFILGFDIGVQEKNIWPEHDKWYSPVAVLRYKWSPKIRTALRAEYYYDPGGVIVPSQFEFETYGYSFNLDYVHSVNTLLRIEFKNYSSAQFLFLNNRIPSPSNNAVTASLSVAIR